jgi:hypothetical protein
MELASISAAVTSLKAAGEIVKGMISLKTTTEVQAKAIELNQEIISAQHAIFQAHSAQSALIVKIADLEKQIAQMRQWEEQKQRYKLANPWRGPALAYGVRKSCKDSEIAHWICTKCYDEGRRSILNPAHGNGGFILMVCPTCKAQLQTGFRGIGPAEYVDD